MKGANAKSYVELMNQLESVVIALSFQEVCEGKPDKAHQLQLLVACRRWLREPAKLRQNVQEIFNKRDNFFHPSFLLGNETLSDEVIDDLLQKFPESMDSNSLNKLWITAKKIQSFCRNTLGPKYAKLQGKKWEGFLLQWECYNFHNNLFPHN